MATVLFQSLPSKALLALDFISLTTSPAFQGIRNVPPGVHFVLTGTDAGLSIRHGIWFIIPQAEVSGPVRKNIIFRWYDDEERLVQILDETSPAISHSGERGLRDQLGGGLVDYALQTSQNDGDSVPSWQAVTNYIDAHTLTRILTSPSSPTSWTVTSASSAPQDLEQISNIDPSHFTSSQPQETETLSLLPIDLKRTWRPDAVGRERSEAAQDRSWALGNILDSAAAHIPSSTSIPVEDAGKRRELGAKQLLAELQFCFAMIMLLGNYSCLEQWRRITGLIFTCKRAVAEVEKFFVLALKTLGLQLRCLSEAGMFETGGMSEEFRDDFGAGSGAITSREGRMRKILMAWRKTVEEILPDETTTMTGGRSAALKQEIKSFWAVLRDEFGWEDDEHGITVLKRGMVELEDGERVELEVEGADEEEERGEYAPVVVDLG